MCVCVSVLVYVCMCVCVCACVCAHVEEHLKLTLKGLHSIALGLDHIVEGLKCGADHVLNVAPLVHALYIDTRQVHVRYTLGTR